MSLSQSGNIGLSQYPSVSQQLQPPFNQKQLHPGPQQGQFSSFSQINPPTVPQNQNPATMMQQQNVAQQHPQLQQHAQMMQQAQQSQAIPPFGANFPGNVGVGGRMQGSPPPMSGNISDSPYRGSKRKTDSPHIGGAGQMNMNAMGPPSIMPNRLSMPGSSGASSEGGSSDPSAAAGMNGMLGNHQQAGSSQSPRPQGTSNDMTMAGGVNFGMNVNVGAPQTSMRQRSVGAGIAGDALGSGVPVSGPPINHAQVLTQQQQQQRQQARQGSIPPGVSSMRSSVPPIIPGTNFTSPVTRTPVPGGVGGSPNSGCVPSPSILGGGNMIPATGSVDPSSSGSSLTSNDHRSSASVGSAGSIAPGQPPLLPKSVQLNPATTQITPVPLADYVKLVPPISEEEIHEIQGWMKVDRDYEGTLRKMKERMTGEISGMFGGSNGCWWEKGAQSVDVNRWRRGREMFDIRFPLRRGKEKEGRERRKRQREGLRLYVSRLLVLVVN